MVRIVYLCERCGQFWNYRNDAQECEESCNGERPTDKRIAG